MILMTISTPATAATTTTTMMTRQLLRLRCCGGAAGGSRSMMMIVSIKQQQQKRLVTRTRTTSSSSAAVVVRAGAAMTPSTTIRRSSSSTGNSAVTSSSTASSSSSGYTNNNTTTMTTTAGIAAASLAVGFGMGRYYHCSDDSVAAEQHKSRVLPNGLPRTCCEEKEKESGHEDDDDDDDDDDDKLTPAQRALRARIAKVIGQDNVIDGRVDTTTTLPFLKGARLGHGHALCIVTPRRLQDVATCVQFALEADCVILPQGSNTGLTGGSVPHCHHNRHDNDDDSEDQQQQQQRRPTVILSMKHLNRIFPIDDGHRVVCLAGAGLAQLEQFLRQYFPDRESHSTLGSTYLNPTTAAGVAFGSGGTQCRKGPAYTERALYLKVSTNKWREQIVELVDTLGVDGLGPPTATVDAKFRRKQDNMAFHVDNWSRWMAGGYQKQMLYSAKKKTTAAAAAASDEHYATRLCQCDGSVSRWNADTRGPEFNRSEGKVIILATVHDTFPKPLTTQSYWISFDSLATALEFRRDVCLDNPTDLPVSCEYMDRDAYDVIDRSGRLMASVIKCVGTSSSIVRSMYNVKLWIEALPFAGAPLIVDKFLHLVNPIIPSVLPRAVMETGQNMDHHVAMTVGEYGDGNLDRLLQRMEQFATRKGKDKVVIHECSAATNSLNAFRFVAAPCFRTWCVGEGAQGISIDYALPKNGGAVPPIPSSEPQPLKRMRYSHFGCNVVHEDVAYGPDVDVHEAKYALKKVVEKDCGGKLPAEHGHGTEYVAPPEAQRRWKKMDPLNVLNPGVGGLSEKPRYAE